MQKASFKRRGSIFTIANRQRGPVDNKEEEKIWTSIFVCCSPLLPRPSKREKKKLYLRKPVLIRIYTYNKTMEGRGKAPSITAYLKIVVKENKTRA